MKIVIDIPEEVYNHIVVDSEYFTPSLVNAFKNGTPLPKGHGRLIDADAYAKKYNTNINGRIGEEYVIAPTIIEADTENKE